MTSIDDRKTQLEARRDELLQRMQQVEQELNSHTSKDWEDQATEQEDDEVLQAMGESARDEVVKIDAALQRIAEDEYGFCAKCGAEIGDERLDLVPYTPFCRNCAP